MKRQAFFSQHWMFLCVFVLCIAVRAYHLPGLTGFGRDQGIDYLTVQRMIVDRKITLLGIKVSIADFHQGPVYLYCLLPFFLLTGGHPIAGALAALTFAALTVFMLYVLMVRFFGKKEALLSTVLFSVSPEFVKHGNTPLYQHFLTLFLLISLFAILSLVQSHQPKKERWWLIVLGISSGISLELHFLAITIVASIFLWVLKKYWMQKRNFLLFVFGLFIGVLPTLLFELRHQFLNTQLLWAYITAGKNATHIFSLFSLLSPWVSATAKWFAGEVIWLGALIAAVSVLAVICMRFKKSEEKTLQLFLLMTGVLTLGFQILLSSFEAHYTLPVMTLLMVFLPIALGQIRQRVVVLLLGIFVCLVVFNASIVVQRLSANHGYDMPPGWNQEKMLTVAEDIKSDAKEKSFNIASLLDGDTRAYPLRYVFYWMGLSVESEEMYPQSKLLYVVGNADRDKLMHERVWEIDAFRPFEISAEWDVGDQIVLYRLEKKGVE